MVVRDTLLIFVMLLAFVSAFNAPQRILRCNTRLLHSLTGTQIIPEVKKKTATVERIVSVAPIQGAGSVELATVCGWNVIVRKNEFAAGDFAVYIAVDTIVDLTKPWFNFLKSDRIKTIKLQRVYSQGLLLPLSAIPYQIPLKEGHDVSELLGVSKYEKPFSFCHTPSPSSSASPFPSHIISITDEDHLNSKPEALQELYDKEIYITLKLDGSSMTMIWEKGDRFTLCSRRVTLYTAEKGLVNMDDNSPMTALMKNMNWLHKCNGHNIAVQGEFCGPKVNGNRLGLTSYQYYVFTVKDLDSGRYYTMQEVNDFCAANGFNMVPILKVTQCTADWTLDKFQAAANDVTYASGKTKAEGIVIRPTVPFYSEVLEKSFSVKVINQGYKD